MRLIYVAEQGGKYQLSGDLTWDEYMKVMETGILGDSEICAIECWMQPPTKDPEKARILLFDFDMKRGGEPLIKCYRYVQGSGADALRSLR